MVEIAGEKHQIRQTHWRYLRAKIDCIDAGKPLTGVNHAKFAGVSRVALWKLQRRYPWLDGWCDQVLRGRNAHRWSTIEQRMASLGEQGSVAAADQYCKMQGGYYIGRGSKRADEEDDPEFDADGGACVINILVPHPDLPQGGRMPPLPGSAPALPQGLSLKDIPTVAVR